MNARPPHRRTLTGGECTSSRAGCCLPPVPPCAKQRLTANAAMAHGDTGLPQGLVAVLAQRQLAACAYLQGYSQPGADV